MGWSRVIVMPARELPRSEEISHWHALWEGEASPTAPLGEFDGSREEAVRWARERRPTELWVYDFGARDIVQLPLGGS